MTSRRALHSASRILAISAAIAGLTAAAWAASATKLIYSFAGDVDGDSQIHFRSRDAERLQFPQCELVAAGRSN